MVTPGMISLLVVQESALPTTATEKEPYSFVFAENLRCQDMVGRTLQTKKGLQLRILEKTSGSFATLPAASSLSLSF